MSAAVIGTFGPGWLTASGYFLTTIRAVIDDLERKYPGLKERICEGDGKVRRFVNIYLNDEDIRFKKNIDTELKDNDELSIIPAIAGGLF